MQLLSWKCICRSFLVIAVGWWGTKAFEHRLNVPENTSVSVRSLNESLNALSDTPHVPKSCVFKRVTPSNPTTSLRQNCGENLPPTKSSGSLNHQRVVRAVLKVLFGVGLGFLLYTNPEARQITGDLLRAAGNAIAPPIERKNAPTTQKRITDALTDQD